MRLDHIACGFDIEIGEPRGARTGSRHHHVVDRRGQLVEETLEPGEVGGVERRDARPQLEPGAVDAIRVARRDDDPGTFVTCAPGRLEADAGATADDDQGLSGKFGTVAHDGRT